MHLPSKATIGSIVIGTGVFIGLSVATGGLFDVGLVGGLALVGLWGIVSGVAGQATYDLLAKKKMGWDLATSGALNGVLSVALLGAGRLVAPFAERAAAAVIPRVVAKLGPVAASLADRLASKAMASDAAAKLDAYALERLAQAARTGNTAAAENQAHILRQLDWIEQNKGLIEAKGYDPRVVRTAILYSDLGKNADYFIPHMKDLALGDNPSAPLVAFLDHETPGITEVALQGQKLGVSQAYVKAVEDAIVGHNGPAVPGSWWGDAWASKVETLPENPQSPLVGKPYPLEARSPEGAIVRAADRGDQATLWYRDGSYAGGVKKIMNDNMTKFGLGMKDAATGAFQGNAEKTILQLDEVYRQDPWLADFPFMQDVAAQMQQSVDLLNNVTWLENGSAAEVALPDGSKVVARSFEEFWGALDRIPPSSVTPGAKLDMVVPPASPITVAPFRLALVPASVSGAGASATTRGFGGALDR
jgi:hypothetical protein